MAGEDVDFGRATITIDINDGNADSESRTAGLRIQRALLNATRRIGEQMRRQIQRGLSATAVTVRVEPDLSRFDARLINGLRSLQSINIPVAPDVTGFVERLRALLADVEIPIRVVPGLDGLDARVRAHNAPDITVGVNVDGNRLTRALAGLGSAAGRVGGALTGLLRFGAIGIAAAGAAQGVGALVAALAPAAGIVAAYPAAIASAQVALGTLRLALVGVQDALSAALSGDAEKFSKAIEGLSPAAQKAVTAIRDLQPELKQVQQSVQQSFFRQFSGDVAAAIRNLLPLGSGLDKVAAFFGKAASEGLAFAASAQAARPLRQIIQGTADATSGLAVAIAPLAKGFLDVAAAVSEAFGVQVGAGIGQVGAQVGTFLSEFAASGRAVEVVRGALEVFKQLGAIASNGGHIISGVFQAANTSGGGLLNNLITITGAFREFVSSAQGQEAIASIFRTVATIAAQVGPIVGALITQLGGIAPALEPIFESLGPALVNLVNSLGPALSQIAPALATLSSSLTDGLAALGPALGPLGSALASVVTALSPALPLFGSLANTAASLLAPALQIVAASLQPMVSSLVGALMPILPPLTQALLGLLQALIPLGVATGQMLGQALAAVSPLLSQLALVVSQVVVAVTPLVAQIVAALLPALPPLVAAFQAVLQAVLPLLPPVLGLVQALVPLVSAAISLASPLLQVAAAIASWAVINVVVPMISGIVSALSSLISVVTTVASVVASFAQAVVAGFRWLYNTLVGHSIIPDLIRGIVSWFRRLPGMAASALGSLVSAVVGPIRSAASAALARASSFVTQAVSTIRALPGKARTALGNLGSTLVGAGRDLVRGLINGVKQMAGAIASAAKNVVSGAIKSAKSVLGIASPSKVFAQIGRDTGAGFVKGLIGTAASIKATVEKIAKEINGAFRGRATRLDDRLVAMLQAGNKRLTSLAAQRDALVQRIADAQKFAADTSKAALDAFSLQNLTQGQEAVTTAGLQAGLQNAIDQVKRFNAQIASLAKRGLSRDLVQQIIGLGPVQGAEIATVLSQSTKDNLKRLNSLQAQLTKAAGTLGTTSADVLYDAGKQAGAGFLAGLKAQRKSIEKLMLDIAKGMQAAIRTALRIKSPSRVMMRIGDMTGLGLQLGLVQRIAALKAASRAAAQALVRGVSSQVTALSGAAPSLGGGNVVPLTRSQRLRQAGPEPRDVARLGRANTGGDVIHNHHWEIREVGSAHVTAQRVLNRFVLAAGVSG